MLEFLRSSALKPERTSIRGPWQNGIAERWAGNARRELLDHIIPLNEYHLRRLGLDYLAYYHQDQTHIRLNKNTPAERAVESRSSLSKPNRVDIAAWRSPPSLPLVGNGVKFVQRILMTHSPTRE